MKVVISSGHGKYIRGASGSPVPPQCDEVDEARRVVDRTAALLREAGHEAIVFHDDTSHDQNTNLHTIVDFHNRQTRDLDVSVHFNAYDGSAHGCEVLYVSNAGEEYADTIVDAICEASGLTNRGPKKRTDLYFLNNTSEVAVLVETAFCDNTNDCATYKESFEDICRAIAEGITFDAVTPGPPPTEQPRKQAIMAIANASAIAGYEWEDRGQAPVGYVQGFALGWATVVAKFLRNDPVAIEMAKADTRDDDLDALSWYRSNFEALEMSNAESGIDTLRHLYVLLLGLGMRESSGRHCEGRDTSASNVSSDTAEAGLYQTSYNASSSCPEFDIVMDEYEDGKWPAYLEEFAEDVTCSASDWQCYGSGSGYAFQELCKNAPPFAMESCALVLRNLRQHYGPINRKEAELQQSADRMLLAVQRYVEYTVGAPPVRPPIIPPTDVIERFEELEARVSALETGIYRFEGVG